MVPTQFEPETLAATQMMTEIWLKPFEYPITRNITTGTVFTEGSMVQYLTRDRRTSTKTLLAWTIPAVVVYISCQSQLEWEFAPNS